MEKEPISKDVGCHALRGQDHEGEAKRRHDAWCAEWKEPLRKELIKWYAGIYTPYTDKQKKQAWAEMIESGIVWTDLYQWNIVPVTKRKDYKPPARSSQ